MATKVFDIEYTIPSAIIDTPYGFEELHATAHIRATSPAEARRICKRTTGALIKDMRAKAARGYIYHTDND